MSGLARDPSALSPDAYPLAARYRTVVIGGGEAGLAAALDAASPVLVVDEHPLERGLIGLDVPYLFGGRIRAAAQKPARLEERLVAARPALVRAVEAGVEVALGTTVWNAYGGPPWILGLADRQGVRLVAADVLILACGALDVPVPVAGWTLRGVMGARGLDVAWRLIGDFTGRRVVALGGLELAVPDVALRLREPPQAIRIEGKTEVEGVSWRENGRWRSIACDTVVFAIDAAPNVEVADLIGARVVWSPERGGFLAASLPHGVSAVGDAAGTAPLARDGWMALALAGPEAVVCACEEVTIGDLRALRPPRSLGAAGPEGGLSALRLAPPQDLVKRMTRAGMGPCQGRRCRAALHALLGYPPQMATCRPPLRPLPLDQLATDRGGRVRCYPLDELVRHARTVAAAA
ncbi:MAG: (2Fe-2S)-binding protein [Acetobacteraceae bacterium]|nr:(2Fe-2S)-binding protein [Acetobacteraceae bacterium]